MKYFFNVFFFLAFFSLEILAINDTATIVILHTNDMHSKIFRYPKIAYLIDSVRDIYPDALLVSAGDLFTGYPIVDKYTTPGEPIIKIMNEIGYDISCIGNHEFDIGQENLNKAFDLASFPFICANIDTREALLHQPKPFYKFETAQGLSIGFLGLVQIEKNGYPSTNPIRIKGIKFYDPVKTINKYKTYKDSVDIFILLSHLGIKTDSIVAKHYPDLFDAIIGGHSHTLLLQGKKVGQTLITQAGLYLRFLGVMTINVYDGKVISITDTVLAIRGLKKQDKQIAQLVNKYENIPEFNQVIGSANEDIYGKYRLGFLVTDAMRESLDCDIAFHNIGGIRMHSLPAGKITKRQIYELQPFNNFYVIYTLNTEEIKVLIRYAYNLRGKNDLLVSGINMELYVDKKGKLKKIRLLTEDGKEINSGTFRVAVNDYMAAAYTVPCFKKKYEATNVIDAQATIDYIRKYSPIDYSNVRRIKIIRI